MTHVRIDFEEEFYGELKGENGSAMIGVEKGTLTPYELFAGALGSCAYSIFIDIIEKMRLEYKSCAMDITMEKREEIPTTCKKAMIKVLITGGDKEKIEKFREAFKLATENCSVYYTIALVAEMEWELEFAECLVSNECDI